MDLAVDAPSSGTYWPDEAVHPVSLQARRVVDPSCLQPGDLLLSADANPDRISQGIHQVQSVLGAPDEHARYTHAMMFVGSGQWILEATFEVPTIGELWRRTLGLVGLAAATRCDDPKTRFHGVFLSHLGQYSANHTLRCRRPHHNRGCELVANALRMVGSDYDFGYIARAAWAAIPVVRDIPTYLGWETEMDDGLVGGSVVCSTLYARAFDLTFDENITGTSGVCSPSHLSRVEGFFSEVELRWLSVGQHPPTLLYTDTSAKEALEY